MTDELIDKLLESLWLQDRLSHNTLQGYRRDLEKIAARLEAGGHTWLDAEAADLADAVYAADEKHSSQARALSACKRLYAQLELDGFSYAQTCGVHDFEQGFVAQAVRRVGIGRGKQIFDLRFGNQGGQLLRLFRGFEETGRVVRPPLGLFQPGV